MSDTLTAQTREMWPTPRASDGPDETSHGRTWSATDRNIDTVAREMALRPTGEGWRTTWPVVSGMPNRAAGCRLVGNSVVPVIPLAIFRAIAALEGSA